jgi:hypothetical protein
MYDSGPEIIMRKFLLIALASISIAAFGQGRGGAPPPQPMPAVLQNYQPVTAERLDVAPTEASLLLEEHSLFTARLDARTRARPGTPLKVAVDPERFHFFDPETGENLSAGAADVGSPAPVPELAAR